MAKKKLIEEYSETFTALGEHDKNPTYYSTVVHSKQFQDWVKYNESLDTPPFDTPESIECGWLSPEHFQAFLNHYAEQVRAERDREVVEICENIRKEIPKTTTHAYELAENVGKQMVLDDIINSLKQ